MASLPEGRTVIKGYVAIADGASADTRILDVAKGVLVAFRRCTRSEAFSELVETAERYQLSDRYLPDSGSPGPSADIAGVTEIDYPAGNHVRADQRVAYDQSPRFGGARDAVWATCTATVYSQPIRTENAVHTVEHGAVWPTYDPQRLTGEQVSRLINLVDGQPDTVLSAYPGLDTVVSVRSWRHQLKLDDPTDERLPRFIAPLRQIPTPIPSPAPAAPRCTSTRPTLPRSIPARQDQTRFR